MIAKIFGILAIFTVFLCTMIGMKQWTLNTGIPILLETQPIDPRSLFRGDYVRLNYVIGNLKLNELEGDDEFEQHDKIYVLLQQQDKYWIPTAVFHQKPLINKDKLFLQGKVQYVSDHFWNPETQKSEEVKNVSVKYGIENYFVPEGEGLDLERRDNDQVVDIRIAVNKYGNAGIKAILVNDEERHVETLF